MSKTNRDRKGEQSLSKVVAGCVNSHFSMSATGDMTGVWREGRKGEMQEGGNQGKPDGKNSRKTLKANDKKGR